MNQRDVECRDGVHRWDAQKALRKGGIEIGDLCFCGGARFAGPAGPAVIALRRLRLWDAMTWAEYRAQYPDACDFVDDEFRRLVALGLGEDDPKGAKP